MRKFFIMIKNLYFFKKLTLNKVKHFKYIKNIKNSIKFDNRLYYLDYFILVIVIFAFVGDFFFLITSIIKYLIENLNINVYDYINFMAEPNTTTQVSTNTTTTIIHNDGSWGGTVRTIFIYGTGAFRLSLLRNGGTPGSRAFVIASTIAGDSLSKMINNTINDPSYVRNHYQNWKAIWNNSAEGEAKVQVDDETLNKLSNASNNSTNFLGDSNNFGNMFSTYINGIFEKFKYILEPVKVNYSDELLANQIYDLSILLFILSILITGLIIILLFNLFLFINIDRIIKIFNNKFIRWYLLFNKKIMSIEILILGSSIIYFMHILSKGILFIATHPIDIN
jgi:hypothetical protein